MQRAARVAAKALGEADPANAAAYRARAKAYEKRLAALKSWAKAQVATIPRRDRILATAHLAFGYFCKEFGFRALGVRGLTTEQEAGAKHIAEAIATIRRERVKAVFPEEATNPKVLRRIAREAGVKVGGKLDPAFTGGRPYVETMRRNVETIVKGLR
jgi:zinc/manganese transport system substrate-binding protein